MFEPLNLTPVEWCMLLGPGGGAENTFFIDLHFRGDCEAQAFRGAADAAVRLHPLMCAHIRGTSARRMQWAPATDPSAVVDIADRATPCTFPGGEGIDLWKQTGLRTWVRTGGGTTAMRFQFHHACCDGTGAYRVIEDVLCAYDREVCGDDSSAEHRPVDAALMKDRGKIEPRATAPWLKRRVAVPISGGLRFFCETPAPLREPSGGGEPGDRRRLPELLAHIFTRQQTDAVRTQGARAGGTSYAVLVRDLLSALAQWNGEAGSRGRSVLRIIAPISLRTPADEALPAMNRVTVVRVDRRRQTLKDPAELLKGIVNELGEVEALGRDRTFHRLAAMGQVLPPLQWHFRRAHRRCHATTVLSSMGKVLAHAKLPRRKGVVSAGGLELQSVQSAPPALASTPVVFGCGWYARRLTLTLNYHRDRFAPQPARELLDLYVRHVRDGIESVAPTTP